MADEQEVTIKITTDADLSDAETLEDLIEQLRDQASDIPLDFEETPAQDDVEGLQDSLDGLSALAVGGALQQYGSSAENMAQQMNQASISVGQLATNVGMAEGDMVNLINNISNATFPQSEAMAYVDMLNQMGVSSDKLGESATNIDKINDATGMGYQGAMQLVRGFGALGVSGDNLQSTFNAVAYAEANSVGGAADMGNILKMQAGTLNQYNVGVDAATVAISDLSHKYGSARKAGAALSEALKENDGDLAAVEQQLGLQPGALTNASAATGQYQGKLEELASEEAEHKTLLDQLGAAWEDLSLSLGGIASPIMGVVGLGGQVAGFGTQLNGAWELLSKLKNVGPISSALSGLSGAIGGAGGITGALSGAGSALMAFATGPIGIAIAAIIALGVAIYEAGKYFGWWQDLPSMFAAIQAGIGELWNAFMSNEYVVQAINMIKQGLTDAWNAIVGFGSAIMSALGGAGGEFDILSWAINGLQTVLSAVGPVVIFLIQAMIQHFRNIYAVGQMIWPYLSTIISSSMAVIRGIISGAMSIWTGLQGAWRGLQSTASSVFGAINGIVSAAGGAWNSFKSTVMGVIQPIIDKINDLKNAASGVGDLLHSVGFGGLETPAFNAGYGGGSTMVSQGNTIIFNMYGDIRDEKTLDDTIDAINNRIQFEALGNGTTTTDNGGAI